MRCAICDSDSDTVTLDSDCSVCQAAIFDCLSGYPDNEEEVLDQEYDDS